MLTTTQLLTLTPKTVRYRASYPSVQEIRDKVVPMMKARMVYTKTSLGNTESTGSVYSLTIRNYGTRRILPIIPSVQVTYYSLVVAVPSFFTI